MFRGIPCVRVYEPRKTKGPVTEHFYCHFDFVRISRVPMFITWMFGNLSNVEPKLGPTFRTKHREYSAAMIWYYVFVLPYAVAMHFYRCLIHSYCRPCTHTCLFFGKIDNGICTRVLALRRWSTGQSHKGNRRLSFFGGTIYLQCMESHHSDGRLPRGFVTNSNTPWQSPVGNHRAFCRTVTQNNCCYLTC
ncbi:MAG: hypothetical protein CM1200mP18_11430 [Gammaproteobacteria bacterium]|nr:MAG: hypothetical protein CM1200mP18_11430 [Gammaproteobacteria bacterium]